MPVFTFEDTEFQRDDMICQRSHRGPGRAGGESGLARASGIQERQGLATTKQLP